jgi:hypothetical protein
MNYKPIIFFILLFCIILYCYFNYETFIYYVPLPIIINSIIVIIGVSSFFFPHIIKMWKEGEDIENIKEFIIEKYKKK